MWPANSRNSKATINTAVLKLMFCEVQNTSTHRPKNLHLHPTASLSTRPYSPDIDHQYNQTFLYCTVL
uniref:Uncharacterized protein n=1 Tax=Anguilla anguilla TaxID=7936 RepID=A0A0E9VEC4_ANGAN